MLCIYKAEKRRFVLFLIDVDIFPNKYSKTVCEAICRILEFDQRIIIHLIYG